MLTHKRRLALRLVQLEAIRVDRVSGDVVYEEKGSWWSGIPQRPFRWLLSQRYIELVWMPVGSDIGEAHITTRGEAAL